MIVYRRVQASICSMLQTLLQARRVYAMPHVGGPQAETTADGVMATQHRTVVEHSITEVTLDAVLRL